MDPIRIQITLAMLDALKHALRKRLSTLRPGHLSEALAAGLGYGTYAALLSSGEGRWSSFDPVAFDARLAAMGLLSVHGQEAMDVIRSVVSAQGLGKQVEGWLAREDVSEIILRANARVLLETMGKLREGDTGLGKDELQSLMLRLALESGKEHGAIVDGVHPRGFRFIGIDAPFALDGPTLTIRKQMPSLRMEQLVSAGMLSAQVAVFLQGRIDSAGDTPVAWGITGNSHFLAGNILITGGSRSGKSLLLGALVKDLSPDLELILVRDPNGISLDRPGMRNWQAKNDGTSCAGHVQAATRLKGNGLIVADFGEDPAASVAMLAIGSAFTMHSLNPDQALKKLLGWTTKSYKNMSEYEAANMLACRVDTVVHTCRSRDGICRVDGVYSVEVIDGVPAAKLISHGSANGLSTLPSPGR